MKGKQLLLVATLVVLTAACRGKSPTRPPATAQIPIKAAPTAILQPTEVQPTLAPPTPLSLEAFGQSLQEALATHDMSALEQLMGERFTLALWRSLGIELAPAEAVQRLRSDLLASATPLRWDEPSEEKLTQMLEGTDPWTVWGPAVKVAAVLYSEGWGTDGKGQALLVVAERREGGFYWHGLLYAAQGFSPASLSLPALEGALVAALMERDLAGLEALMDNPFTIVGWQSEEAAWAPQEAIQQLSASFLPPDASVTVEKPRREQLTALLGGTDPYTIIWGGGTPAASVLYSKGWGSQGERHAFLIITQGEGGRFVWHAILFARPEQLGATRTPTRAATPKPTLARTAAPRVALAIQSFTCQAQDIPTGKRLTFAWTTSGATSARIWSGTTIRFRQAWDVPPNGTLTVELQSTNYPNPPMTLVASDGQGHDVSKGATVAWPCRYSYFFGAPSGPCPAGEAANLQAAQQAFQNGRLVWLKEIPSGSSTIARQIIALYNDGKWAQFDDTWQEGQPESDPAITPPGGLYQPIRGFGKLWREHADVKSKLGWALAPEQGYTATWQRQMCEALPDVSYLRTADGQTLELAGVRDGSWRRIGP